MKTITLTDGEHTLLLGLLEELQDIRSDNSCNDINIAEVELLKDSQDYIDFIDIENEDTVDDNDVYVRNIYAVGDFDMPKYLISKIKKTTKDD